VGPAPARLGLPAKRFTFLAVVIAEAFGTLAGRRGFALRFAGEAAVAAIQNVELGLEMLETPAAERRATA